MEIEGNRGGNSGGVDDGGGASVSLALITARNFSWVVLPGGVRGWC